MMKNGLNLTQQAKLDDLLRNLISLNSEIEGFRVYQTLTFSNQIREMAAKIKRERIISKIRKILKESTTIPIGIQEFLR